MVKYVNWPTGVRHGDSSLIISRWSSNETRLSDYNRIHIFYIFFFYVRNLQKKSNLLQLQYNTVIELFFRDDCAEFFLICASHKSHLKTTFKGTVSVISNNPPCKDGNTLFTTVPLKL